MKKIFTLLMTFTLIFMTGCGGGDVDKKTDAPEKNSSDEKSSAEQKPAANGKKILVVYFSRTGEEYNVGRITTGNTAIVANFIAQEVDADTFEIKPAKPYPDEYEACTEIAKRERELNYRPALAANVENLAQYDTIFLGFPNWWGTMPMIIYNFLESNDFSGKTIIPFCTHGGSGLAATEREIAETCPKAKVSDGLAIVGKRCQDEPEAVRADVEAWLKTLGY